MVEILLPTYNGEQYLSQQLDSILCQTYTDWRLIVRDDGSKDNSLNILCDYAHRYPDKFLLIEDKEGNQGTTKSFELLLKHSTAEYVMLADQDDIWMDDKVEVTFACLRELEAEYPDMPCMVSTDAKCIDGKNRVICESFFRSQKFFHDVEDDVERMIALNIVQGSTLCINRKVIAHVFPIPKDQFHDKWMAVITVHYGHYRYLRRPTLLYRQHDNNVVGANNISLMYFVRRFTKQFGLAVQFYRDLPFKPKLWRWIAYKVWYTMKRI